MGIGTVTRHLIWLMAATLLLGCGVSGVTIEGSFPAPNVGKLPLRLGVIYDSALRDFSYIEYTETGQEEYDIRSGESVMALFDAVLPAMFSEVVFLDSPDEASAAGVDAVFKPAIEEFQLALPYKTKLDVYEVWIKYNLRLLTPAGDYIADWVITSYGKTPQEGFRSNEAAINEAAVVALRDLGSSFVLSFANVPEVKDWLATR